LLPAIGRRTGIKAAAQGNKDAKQALEGIEEKLKSSPGNGD